MAAPSGLIATEISTSQINLSWTDNDGGVATAYDIDRSTTNTGGFAQIATVGSGATAYTNTGLTTNTTYYYEVDAVDAVATSAFSSIANADTLGIPSSLTATTASYTQINLAWTDNDGGSATAYDIDRSTTSTGGFTQIATVGSGATAYSNTGLSAGSYSYEVQAVIASRSSAFSNIANAQTPATEVGGVVTDNFYGTNGTGAGRPSGRSSAAR